MEDWITAKLESMSLEEKVGQMHIVAFWDFSGDFDAMNQKVTQYHLGGVFHITESHKDVARFAEQICDQVSTPLFIASDYEAGTGVFLKEGTNFPRPMARGHKRDAEIEYEIGSRIAKEGTSIGANFTFSPVMDVNVNPLCPDVNIRAYSDDPNVVAELGVGYIRGIQDHGMIATAKHFPGNGGTAMDQHLSPAIIDYPRDVMEAVFLKPFRDAIAAGVGAIMVAHLEVPSLCSELHPVSKRVVPASLSKEIITDLLKNQMGFTGMVMTDALNMGGVMNLYGRNEVNIKAIQAGSDLLLNFSPDDCENDIEAICNAVRSGEISTERIDDAVRRILAAKAKLGLDRESPRPKTESERNAIFSPGRNDQFCMDIATNALTLLRNQENTLPIESVRNKNVTVFSVFSPERRVLEGHGKIPVEDLTTQRLTERGAHVNHVEIDSRLSFQESRKAFETCLKSDYVFLNFFVIPSFAIGSLIPNLNAMRLFYYGILSEAKNVIITSFGDPWVFQYFHTASTYLCTFDETEPSQENAIKAWFGEVSVTGRMPVGLRNVFESGDGIDMISSR